MSDHIILINIAKPLKVNIEHRLRNEFDSRILIASKNSVHDALEYIGQDIDKKGDRLALVVEQSTEREKLSMENLINSHPCTKKILLNNTKEYHFPKLENYIMHIDKKFEEEIFFENLKYSLNEHLLRPTVSFAMNGTIFKMAETLYEKKEFFKTRFKVYTYPFDGTSPLKDVSSLSEKQVAEGWEFDSFDSGGIESMIISKDIRYIIAMNKEKCIGGVRIIEGHCPMEEGVCVSDGKEYSEKFNFKINEKFNLDVYRQKGIIPREVSRLIVDAEYASGMNVIPIMQLVDLLTCDQNFLFCTSQSAPEKVKFYKSLGLEFIGPKINYSLNGDWVPLVRDREKINKNLTMTKEDSCTNPDFIEGLSTSLHKMLITHPIDTFTCNQQSLQTIKEPIYLWRLDNAYK